MKPKSPHMSPEEFKANGTHLSIGYLKYEEVEAYPVMSKYLRSDCCQITVWAPEHPESLAAVLKIWATLLCQG